MRSRKRLYLIGLVALAGSGLIPGTGHPTASAHGESPAECGSGDRPETGIQGDVPRADQESGVAEQGYNCGLTVVGHNDFGGTGGGAMAWLDNCAYVAGGTGIRVLDVSVPGNPTQVEELPAFSSSENMHAVRSGDRAVLVYGRGVYDIRDCADPVVLGEIEWTGTLGAHNVKLNRSATKVYASLGIEEADISDLYHPANWTVTKYDCTVAAQTNPLHAPPASACDKGLPMSFSHEPETNLDDSRLYIANQTAEANAVGGYLQDETLRILDLTTPEPKVIAEVPGPGHGMTFATIDGKPYLLHSDETAPGVPQPAERRANGCLPYEATPFAGTAETFLTDISIETAPRRVSKIGLAINRPEPEFCAAAADSSVNSTVHYHTVDDPEDTTFAMLSMKNAGLRIFDLRIPQAPVEVAYFNPGQHHAADGTTSLDRTRIHARWLPELGHIWISTEGGGFYVLAMQSHVRDRLGV